MQVRGYFPRRTGTKSFNCHKRFQTFAQLDSFQSQCQLTRGSQIHRSRKIKPRKFLKPEFWLVSRKFVPAKITNHTGVHTYIHRHTYRQTDRHIYIQTARQTDRQTDIYTYRQLDRQTYRQTPLAFKTLLWVRSGSPQSCPSVDKHTCVAIRHSKKIHCQKNDQLHCCLSACATGMVCSCKIVPYLWVLRMRKVIRQHTLSTSEGSGFIEQATKAQSTPPSLSSQQRHLCASQ